MQRKNIKNIFQIIYISSLKSHWNVNEFQAFSTSANSKLIFRLITQKHVDTSLLCGPANYMINRKTAYVQWNMSVNFIYFLSELIYGTVF